MGQPVSRAVTRIHVVVLVARQSGQHRTGQKDNKCQTSHSIISAIILRRRAQRVNTAASLRDVVPLFRLPTPDLRSLNSTGYGSGTPAAIPAAICRAIRRTIYRTILRALRGTIPRTLPRIVYRIVCRIIPGTIRGTLHRTLRGTIYQIVPQTLREIVR